MPGTLSFREDLLTLGPASLCRKPGDGVEFFAHMRLILKKGEGRQGLPCPEVRTAGAAARCGGTTLGCPTAPLPPPLHLNSSPPWSGPHRRPLPERPHRSSYAVVHQPLPSPWTPAVA